jgi:hypothetical protein
MVNYFINKYSFILAALLLSPASFALSTSFELPDDIQFAGSVVSPAPTWKWRVHPSVAGWAADWTMKKSQGVEQGDGTTHFSYDNADKKVNRNAFIQGMMTRPSKSGRADIVPHVSFLVEGGPKVLNGNTIEEIMVIPAEGQTKSGTRVYGHLTFSVESAYAVFYRKPSDTTSYYSDSYSTDIGWAVNSILIENKLPEYNGLGVKHVRRDIGYDIKGVIGGTVESSYYDVAGAFGAHLGHFHGIWTDIPHTWTATLTANVRMN